MAIDKLQKQTNINIQEKANLIWEIATHLYGEYKPHEYGKVILPMTVIKRFDDALKDTKKEVVEKNNELNSSNKEVNDKTRHAILKNVAKHDFYNTSKFDFAGLIADADNIKENFTSYLQAFRKPKKKKKKELVLTMCLLMRLQQAHHLTYSFQ